MYPIHLTSKGIGLDSFEEFKKNFVEICDSHRKADRALCFAFILYRTRDAYMPGILCNTDYWNALDDISGKYLTVFSFVNEKRQKANRDNFQPGVMRLMISVNSTESPDETSELFLAKYFDFDGKVNYPAILFFQVSNKEIISPFVIGLKKEGYEIGFNEIKNIMLTVEDTLKNITEENKGNTKEIINLVRQDIEHKLAVSTLISSVNVIKSIADFAGTFKGIVT